MGWKKRRTSCTNSSLWSLVLKVNPDPGILTMDSSDIWYILLWRVLTHVIDALFKHRYFLDDFSFLSGSEKVRNFHYLISVTFCFQCRLMKGWGLQHMLQSTITQRIEIWDLQMWLCLKVSWIKLREGGRSTRCVASCCYRSYFSYEHISGAPHLVNSISQTF